MPTIAERKSQNLPRFKKPGCDDVYGLFDAFVKTAFMDNRAIDFSQEPTRNEDGSFAFATRGESFLDKYHLEPVALTYKIGRVYGLTAGNLGRR